jgi:hypothetical protein
MPFTLFHYPFGYWLSKVSRKLSLSGLVVGAVIPDIEVPFMVLFFSGVYPDHFVLHSLIGALTIGLILALGVTRYVYPSLIGKIFALDRKLLDEACRFTPMLVVSCVVGIISHIAVDIPLHWYNPVLWPWVNPFEIVGPICAFFASLLNADIITGYAVANLFANGIMAVVLITIVFANKEDRWKKLWIGT